MTDTSWQNRIVGSGTEAPEQLLANPANWRRHPAHQHNALNGVFEQVGWVQEVIVNQRTGFLVDGHLRVELAMRKGQAKVPVKYVDLSPEDEALVLATLDPIGALATADSAALDMLLEDVQTQDGVVLAMLNDLRAMSTPTVPVASDPAEPRLLSERCIEILCTDEALDAFRPVLAEWGMRDGVTINIS